MALEEPELRAIFHDIDTGYGTHRPALCEAIVRTSGPILELGMGDSSTPALHEVALGCDRLVCSYDHDPSWAARYLDLRSDHHQVESVSSWDECPIESRRWGVALVDHDPAERRIVDIARLADHADVVVVHDTQDVAYGYDRIFDAFKYRLDYRDDPPWTTLLSNSVDVSSWTILADGLVSVSPRRIRTSVIVPCAGKHVARLPELFAALRAQTRKPDEVVVSVSSSSLSSLSPLAGLDAEFIHSPRPRSAGANRNRASAIATGDVLIYQDADDLPHPQRVEIVAHLFETRAIDHLMHFFYYMRDEPTPFALADASASCSYHSSLMDEVKYREGLVEYVTNGNVAVTRALALAVRWPEHSKVGEDQEFNRAIYARTKRTAVVPLPLITYRHNFSTFTRGRRRGAP